MVKTSTMLVLQRLQGSLGAGDHPQLSDIQTQLCALLQTLLKRLEPADVAQCADGAMQIFIAVFHATSVQHLRAVQEDALMAMSALINGELLRLGVMCSVKRRFHQVSAGRESLCSELPRTCERAPSMSCCGRRGRRHLPRPRQRCGAFLCGLHARFACRALCTTPCASKLTVKEPRIDRSVKPEILSCFGDVASAIGGEFKVYLDVTMAVLQQASAVASQNAVRRP